MVTMGARYSPPADAILTPMRGHEGRRLQAALTVAALGLVLASCSSSPSSPKAAPSAPQHGGSSPSSPSSTTTTATPPSTLPPVATSGPLTAGSPIALPFSADRVTAAESPDGAVFAAPQDPTSPAPAVAWVVDANGPAAIAEHVPTGIAALAADSTNFYVATYATVYGYNRASGNQDGQWTMPARQRGQQLRRQPGLHGGGRHAVFVSVTQGGAVSVYSLDPTTSAPPHLVVRGLGDAIGPDGSVFYESDDHHLAVLPPRRPAPTGPVLAHTPNGLGGGVQYVDVVAGGAVWVSQPAGQGLDAEFTTYDTTTLGVLGSYSGSVTSSVVETAAGPLVLVPAGNSASCPQASPPIPASCVLRIDPHGVMSDALGVGAAVTLIGPGPAVVVADTATGQFVLVRLS